MASSSSASPSGWLPTFTSLDYAKFFSAGALCATATHGAMTPVDVVKTRIQLEPKGSKLNGMATMTRHIIASEGPSGLLAGFGPTAVGYLIQGGAKFAGFEFFKLQGAKLAGSREAAEQYRTAIYVGGSSAAELIATTLLTPLEAARIRLVSTRGYASGLVGAVGRMAKEGGLREFYAGYAPILCKQIPYAIGQFTTMETLSDLQITKDLKAKGHAAEVAVDLGNGVLAGFAAAILSHPADTLLSKINRGGGGSGSAMSKLIVLAKETGPVGIWAGLGTRMLMTGFLIAGQFALYAQIKKAVGAPPGIAIAKAKDSSKA
ncbi:mitochondrial carrier [Ceraceosorus bombacis]|uniref:Mitochondrial carrier n=1 Tax=Ceraceosorus bombacis TaxID=401625 RepID=A0A0P1BSK3_9BASI|nr:mitochondrial carrier [Ceraceosorus bombacis]